MLNQILYLNFFSFSVFLDYTLKESFKTIKTMKLDLSKIFWSNCRAKILEKLLLEYESWNNKGFHMRALSRDLWEQINSIKRELDNLHWLWFLKYKLELKKKIFFINEKFVLLNEFKNIFLLTYDPIEKIKKYYKDKKWLELIVVNENLKDKLIKEWKNILDIFMIWDIEKDNFNNFLSSIFFSKKVKYAIISTEDFYNRLKYWDKLIKNILNEKWNIFLRDNLKIQDKLNIF